MTVHYIDDNFKLVRVALTSAGTQNMTVWRGFCTTRNAWKIWIGKDSWIKFLRVLEAVVKILRPVKIATKVLESETEPTINRLAEDIFDMEEHLKDAVDDESVSTKSKHFAKNLRMSLKRRFAN